MNWLKKYWLELLVFAGIFAILMIDLNPNFTFINKAADSMGYTYSAKYLYPSYHTSAPLFLLLGHVFLMIPVATEAWRFGLISVLSTMGACVFLYLVIKQMTAKRLLAIFGVLIYGMSALVISQSIVIETYALVCFLAIGAYYFAINKKWKLMAVMLGLGLAVHLLSFIVAFIMFLFFKEFRKNWKAVLIMCSFLLFYLYIPLTNRPPYMWLPNPADKNSVMSFISDTASVITMLIGTISVWDLPKRIFDTIGIVGLSIGVLTVIPLFYYLRENKKKLIYLALFWLAVAPIILFISELDMNTFDYTMVAMPFLTIMICLGMNIIIDKGWGKKLIYACMAVVVGLGIYNAWYFDIGTNLDKNMSASEYYYTELAKVPDYSIVMPNDGWDWEAIYLYNREFNKHLYPICEDILPSVTYQHTLEADGIKLIPNTDPNLSIESKEMAKSIIALNDNVWTTIETDPSTFGVEVVNANHDTSLVPALNMALIQQNDTHPTWKFMPDNPYNILTTSIFITKWSYVIMSKYNLRLFLVIFAVIYALMIFVPKFFKKKVADEHTRPK
jgi:hypothetical protein